MRERVRSEQAFHDEQAERRAVDLAAQSLWLDDTDYLDHETWIRPALAQLGDMRGRRVLDYGCGHGMAAVVLARRGARVVGFDLSGGYLREAQKRALANGIKVAWVQANGEELPFANESFDAVWGNAILHHLDLAQAAPELFRVLAPGGVAVFCEPWGENRLLAWARRRLPYPGKARTPDETPLDLAKLVPLQACFGSVEVRGQQLLAMAGRFLGRNCMYSGLWRCDQAILRRFPMLERYCRYVILTLRKPESKHKEIF